MDCNISIIRTHIHAKSVYIKKAFFSKIVSVKKLLNFLLISLKEYDSGVNRPLRRSDFHGFANRICESTEQIRIITVQEKRGTAMVRMEIALFLVVAFVAYMYFSAQKEQTALHRTFSVLLVVVLEIGRAHV